MMCIFRIHRLQYDLRGPKRAQNFDDVVRTLIKSLVQRHSFKKAGPPIRQSDLLRNPPVECMSTLGSFQEHLVQSDRSILCEHNYLGLLKSATRLCTPRTVSSSVIRTPCVPPNTQSLQRNALVRFRCLASPIIFSTHLNTLWVALFALSTVRNKAT